MNVDIGMEIRESWNAIAEGYDEFVTPTHFQLASEGLELAGARTGVRLLDVACGSGALSIPAARLGADVVAVDIAPTMVERLAARADREGLTLEARVMDGHALELDDETFDIAASQFGVMLFPDLPRALLEMARVTRPGGRVALIVYGPLQRVEFLGFFLGALQAAVPGFTGLPMDPPPLPFQAADPAALRARLAEAGLSDIRVETLTEQLEFRSAADMWDWVVNSNPIGAGLVADLSDQQRADAREVLDRMLRERAGGAGSAVLTNPVHVGIGVK